MAASAGARGRAALAALGLTAGLLTGVLAGAPAGAAPGDPLALAYPDFSSTAGLVTAGDAVAHDGLVQLTDATPGRSGALWSATAVSPSDDLHTDFGLDLHDAAGDTPGDGVTFTLQDTAAGTGAVGDALGYGGLTPSVAVQFDDEQDADLGDPSADYVAVVTDGSLDHTTQPADRVADLSASGPALYGAGPVHAWIDYTAATHELAVYVGATTDKPTDAVLDVTLDLGQYLSGSSAVAGLTGGTGTGTAVQDVTDWHLTGTEGGDPVPPPNSAITLTAAPAAPATYGTRATLTARARRTDGGSPAPAGTVTFTADGTTLGTATLNAAGVATLRPAAALRPGAHTLTADYAGDGTADPATMSTAYQVAPAAVTLRLAPVSGAQLHYGAMITATVTAPKGLAKPAGTVTWSDDATGSDVSTSRLSGGKATLARTALPAGADYRLSARFTPDDAVTYAPASVGGWAVQVDPATTSMSLTSTRNPVVRGGKAFLVATLRPQYAGTMPTGEVTFYDGDTVLGRLPVNGPAPVKLSIRSLAVGTYHVTAVYGGDANFTGYTTAPLDQVVTDPNTGTTDPGTT